MNRREFLKSMMIMVGACWLGILRPRPHMLKLTITDPQGKVETRAYPVSVITGHGQVWYTTNILEPYPVWQRIR